ADAVAIDPGDDGLRAVRYRLVHQVRLEDLALETSFLLPVHVPARGERLVSRTGQNHDAHLLVGAGSLERQGQLLERVAGERVVLLRPIDRDARDMIPAL